MTKTLNLLAAALLLGSTYASAQNCDPIKNTAPAAEVTKLKGYLDANKIKAKADPRGFFYTIDKEGKGTKPTVCNTVSVNYKGQLTDGKVFDEGNNVVFPLAQLITGWQAGIPLVGTGGSITLYLPPTLAYGAAGGGPIPPNSDLIFKIDLNEVK